MSSQNKPRRTSSHKKRKLHYDSDEISLDRNLELCIDSAFKKNSQTSSEIQIDLFGEIIPPDVCISNADAKNKSVKKTPVSRKKKLPNKDTLIDTPVIRPKRVFIPTPRMMKVMMEAQKELYSFMNSSPSNVSIASTDSLNVSGVQHLQNSPITTIRNEPKIKKESNDNDKKSQQVLKGVVAFIDYKIDNDKCDSSIANHLINLGAKVEKTFNKKVTHVMFCDGYRSTYNKAVKRNIPLVSARWMEYSKLANKILDPIDYPPVGMEKYTKNPSKIINIPKLKTYKKSLKPSNIERDQLFKSNCDNLMKQFNLSINHNNGNEEKCSNSDTTPQTNIVNKLDDIYKSDNIVNLLSDDLCKVLNEIDSPVPNELMDESNVPIPISILRKHLTPDGKENTTSKKLDSKIVKIEERLNLNFQARKRFRKLLFPSDEDLNNIHKVTNFPTQTKDSNSRMPINSTIYQTPKDSFADNNNIVLQSIACTGMTKDETKILKSSIKNLGKFNFHTKVKPMTTYLITKSQSNQSLDIVFAMSYGCFIVSEDWVYESHRTGKWLSHQPYLISELSEPVKEFQIQRRSTFGSVLKFHIFDNAGKIYISDTCKSPAKLLKRLVNACGGHCTSTKSIANVVIGDTPQMDDNIHEKWILDCISQGILLNKNHYKLVNTNEY
ncbi:microcephalin-like [Aphis gossypii]|uniref:microcephalin-like n=1 Tax=Aphis gossypii TaxID=80765 RepID=UPI002158EB2C|nr:microcephalin-like [Aphis gossypii]